MNTSNSVVNVTTNSQSLVQISAQHHQQIHQGQDAFHP